ncbi:Type I-E CRISPR-associated protein Cas7/Cse4/CasC [Candidatus Nitrotoga sp. HW29]|uniref:type I-E CRISPR-associated protein Cas7/Cse4/CasC n=1 Tax=Candidatus Nitrotoga sp. HW29 TaxID=2886963 RepID=UPI001EF1E9B3|nr:type I-E CRISPR-associated protein Cas7/Cse4/CasC [Candidatus Nitrotoga sp. HW29]CAH1904942.1 Type I-E CRISPR-associated protein Cas7/Cse4/CasC [Candidatus Nitrotoga sp. HW29]
MSLPRFIQIHTLHTYPAALLNRDDAGLAKRLPLGNAVRTRISSQCLKRHWRVTDDQFSLSKLDVPMAIRSRGTLELISQRIQKNGITAALSQAAAEALRDAGLLDKGGKDKKGEDALKTGQAVLMGLPEIDYLVSRCTELAQTSPDEKTLKTNIISALKDEKKNIEAIKHGSGLESALFGRMVTSDILASRDASVSVAHAFTVHQAQVENDYFTVVDDLMQEAGELGSAGIFDTELASGLYYGYVVVDVPQLVENLEGIAAKDCFADGTPAERRELAGRVVQHLLHLIATVSPGAKRGSTAPFDWAKFMLVEAGDWQPRSLAGAFHDALPLEIKGNTDTIRQRAVTRITQEISAMDEAYGVPLARHFLALDAVEIAGAERANLTKLGEWASVIVRQGAC